MLRIEPRRETAPGASRPFGLPALGKGQGQGNPTPEGQGPPHGQLSLA
nr:hypothetical protein [uncultured Halomonas sp.]